MKPLEIRFETHIEMQQAGEKSLERMFESVNPMFCFTKRVWKPQMDIFETQSRIIVQAAMAGVKRDDIVIEISSRAIKISGKRKNVHPNPSATYRLAEIQFGQFERILYLPAVIDTEKVSAKFSNGFLELTLGKLFSKNGKQKREVSLDFF